MSGPPLPRSLHVIGGKALGGAEGFFIRLVNALHRNGAPVAVVTVAGGEIDAAVDRGITRFHAPMWGAWDRYSRWLINRAAAAFGAHVVQTYMSRATRIVRVPTSAPAAHLARLGGYYKLAGYRHADAWVGNTEGIRRYLAEGGLPHERCHVIGNFVDVPQRHGAAELKRLRAQLHVPEDARVILGLGRLHPNKGWSDLLQAFAALPPTLAGHPLWLIMVGDGPLAAELHAQAKALGIDARTTWAGWQKAPSPFYQMADVFVCASRHEPLGNVILEAWANETLVLSTRAQGPLELVEDGVNGLLCEVGQPAALAAGIRTAVGLSGKARAKLIGHGLEAVQTRYSEAAILAAYIDLYRQLAAQRGVSFPDN